MNEKIKLIKSNGTTIDADIICFLEDTTSSKKYVYYTLNELVGVDPSTTVKIYVGKIKQNDVTDVPISEEEWGKLKGIMGEVLKDSENATIKYLPLSLLVDPTIIDEKVIAMPTMYDYINKHRAVYSSKAEEVTANVDVSANEAAPVEEQAQESELVAVEQAPEINSEEIQPQESILAAPIEQIEAPTQGVESAVPETNGPVLEPIDIASIEAKYAQMIDEINELKNKEIEAANRYNATLELSAMHNAQHASYVQNVQESSAVTEAPISEIKVEEPVSETPQTTIAVEPKPVEPSPIEPQQTSNVDIETNWFDMQPQS